MKMIKQTQKEQFNWLLFVIIILIVIIVLLLILRGCDNKTLKPTGNIDIFDIKCNCPDQTKCPDTTNPNGEDTTNNNHNDIPSGEESISGLNVFDDDITWELHSELRIFTSPAYVIEGKLAPGISNSYIFRVRNNNDFNILYNMAFIEENIKNINIRYRIKKDNLYLVGDEENWVTYEHLSKTSLFLQNRTYDEYTLDWKWFEGTNDTEIGKSVDTSYKLTINIVGVEA